MQIYELILIAIGLSMDAFAVSVTNGMCKKNINGIWTLKIGLTFGIFQGVMPIIGYVLGQTFTAYVERFDHIIALVLLVFIGGKMLLDGIGKHPEESSALSELKNGELLMQGLATSIDALAIGVSFAALKTSIVLSAGFIAITTFLFGVAGVFIGKRFGSILNKKATVVGGLILIGIGVKIFVEHMFFS